MIKECNVLGHADRKGKFTSEILIYSKEKEEQLAANSRMQGFAVMNLSVSLRKWCHIEKYGWLPLVAERCSLVASQFWWGKVHFVELMDVLHLCFYVILHVDLMPWSLHPLLMQNAYTFQPYSGLVYRISVHEGHVSGHVSLIAAQIRHYISLGTLGSQESMRLEMGCEHKNTFLFQNSGFLRGDSPTTACQRSHPYLNRYFKYHWLCWVTRHTLHFRLCNKASSATQKD